MTEAPTPIDPEVVKAANRLRDQLVSSFSAQQQDDIRLILNSFPALAASEGWEENV